MAILKKYDKGKRLPKQGPITEADSKALDALYPSTADVKIPYKPLEPSDNLSSYNQYDFFRPFEDVEAEKRAREERWLRKRKDFNQY